MEYMKVFRKLDNGLLDYGEEITGRIKDITKLM